MFQSPGVPGSARCTIFFDVAIVYFESAMARPRTLARNFHDQAGGKSRMQPTRESAIVNDFRDADFRIIRG